MKNAAILAAAFAGAVVFAACPVAAATVHGSGTARTESRALSAFSRVAPSGSFTVDIVAGDKPSAEVTADDNIVPLVITEVKGGVLAVHLKRNTSVRTKTPIVVKITVPSLEGVSASGSGDTAVTGVPGKDVALLLSGSGKLAWKGAADAVSLKSSGSGAATLSGTAKKLEVRVSGSGDVDAGGLAVDDGAVSISGSGAVQVNAKATLDARIAGSGRVRYTGAPTVTKKITGSGTVAPAT